MHTRHRIPNSPWTAHRGEKASVVLEKWSTQEGVSHVIDTIVLNGRQWIELVSHVSAFGELTAKEKILAMNEAEGLHRGDEE
jgi:hypothetical protein